MITHAKFNRKDSKIENDTCIIADIVELDEAEYQKFSNNLLQDFDFIGQRKDLMYQDDDGRHCLLVLGKEQNDGVLVESEGYSYARYSASLPNARDFVKAQIKQLADYIVSEGTEHTDDGRWSNSYDELHYHFGAEVTDTNGTGQLLKEELEQRDEVDECILCEDCVEIGYHLEHCPQCQQGGIAGAMSLLSVVGCNIEDEHEMQSDSGDTDSDNRYAEILGNAMGYMMEKIDDDSELYRIFHENFGMSNEEIEDMGIDSLSECYEESDSDMTLTM